MPTPPYQRVDLEAAQAGPGTIPGTAVDRARGVRWTLIPLSVLACVGQAVLTIGANNFGPTNGVTMAAALIPVLTFAMLFLLVLVINPLLRLLRGPRPFNRAELSCVFTAMLVTSGISIFGLTEQLIPIVATPWNPEWNTPQRGWDPHLLPHLNKKLYLTDEQAIRQFREGVRMTRHGDPIDVPIESAPWRERLAYQFEVFRNIQWGAWVRPLAWWMIFVAAAYGMFYSLTYLVFGYWSQREKLIFPISRISTSLMPEDNGGSSWVPPIFRTAGFWFGFGLSFAILSWNALVHAGWVVGLGEIGLGMGPGPVRQLLKDSVFEGLTQGEMQLKFLIIFTAIAIAFLLPLEISFSACFYFLVGKAIILVMTWMGYGRTGGDFPTDWLWNNNAVTAQGGGAMLLFSVVSLYRCLRDYGHLAAGRTLKEKLRLGAPIIGLVVTLAVMTGWVYWNAPRDLGLEALVLAALFVGLITLVTLGLMRIVAEGGIYWFQAHVSFFHIFKMLGLGNILTPIVLGPFLLIYSVLFLDVKTFLAPNLLNAAHMQHEVRAARRRFHLNLLLCIVISVVVSLGFAIFLAHTDGAQQMNRWFYTQGPQLYVDTAYRAVKTVPEFDASSATWYAVGGGWTALSMFVRRSVFWFPHPIGYIMLINPLMASLWFSFFIGWICKSLVVKYGGKATFEAARVVFLGLMLGELMAVFFWPSLGMLLDFTVRITLNRY